MKIADFFALNPVFRAEDFGAFQNSKGRSSQRTRDSHLRRYTLAGRLIHVRRPLYAVVPYGHQASTFQVDPYLVASRIVPGAVIAYHASLQYHGYAHSLWNTYSVLTTKASPTLEFQGYAVRCIPVPKTQRRKKLELGVTAGDREGLTIHVASLERSLADCLDRPDLGGDWEELWKSYAGVPYLNITQVVDYVKNLGKAITAAKVGYFLEQNQKRWHIDDQDLATLQKLSPKRLTYFDLDAKGRSTAVPRWNLLVPIAIQKRNWEEPGLETV